MYPHELPSMMSVRSHLKYRRKDGGHGVDGTAITVFEPDIEELHQLMHEQDDPAIGPEHHGHEEET